MSKAESPEVLAVSLAAQPGVVQVVQTEDQPAEPQAAQLEVPQEAVQPAAQTAEAQTVQVVTPVAGAVMTVVRQPAGQQVVRRVPAR